MSLLARCAFIAYRVEIRLVWNNMMNSSRRSVYVNGRIDFLLAINVHSEIIAKKIIGLYINIWRSAVISWKL